MFETVTRKAIRFNTVKGNVTVEDLWQMPLQSKSNYDLDNVAKTIAADIRKGDEESFVSTSKSSATDELKLDVVKHIIAFKIKENADKLERMGNAARKQELLAAIDNKNSEALGNMTVEQLNAELAKVS